MVDVKVEGVVLGERLVVERVRPVAAGVRQVRIDILGQVERIFVLILVFAVSIVVVVVVD